MLIEKLVERSREVASAPASRAAPASGETGLAVIACTDPELDRRLQDALGGAPGDSIVLRVAGSVVRPGGDCLRSLAIAAFFHGVRECAVLGHTGCRLAAFDSAAFIDAFRRRGVPRDAFGDEDLRSWAGAIAGPRRGIEASVATLAAAPVLPRDLIVGGLLLDDATGAIEVVVAPAPIGSAAPEPAAPTEEPEAEDAAESPPRAAVPPEPSSEFAREIDALRAFLGAVESAASGRSELERLREDLARQKNPVARLLLVEKFVRRAASSSRDVLAAFARLKGEAASARRRIGPEDLVELFRRAGAGRQAP